MATGIGKKTKWTLGISAILLCTLVLHIYFTTNDVDAGGHTNWQLSRIDFKQSLTNEEAGKLVFFTQELNGVQKAAYNAESSTLTYAYFPGTINPQTVFDQVLKFGQYKAERFILPEEMINGGCPVMKGGEVSRRLVLYWAKMRAKFQ